MDGELIGVEAPDYYQDKQTEENFDCVLVHV